MEIKKLKDAGIKIVDNKIAKADFDKAINILTTASTPQIVGRWSSADFEGKTNRVASRMQFLQRVVDIVNKHPDGKLFFAKDGNREMVVYVINHEGIENYSETLRELLRR